MKKTEIRLSKQAQKDIQSLPDYIVDKFQTWVDSVETHGLQWVRKIVGYHDEQLQGDRKGQRSIRLSKGYRVFYVLKDGEIQIVEVVEINKHKY